MNGLVVSNTGPIIALTGIAQLELIQRIFTRIVIPEAVGSELRRERSQGAVTTAIDAASWVQTLRLRRSIDPLLMQTLDIGEASVIALALEIETDWVLIDERKGRKIASEIYGLKVVGSAGLLVHAKRLGLLPAVKPAIAAMAGNGYWLHEAIIQWALQEAGE